MRPSIRLLWALDIHCDDEVVLRSQVDGERVSLLAPDAIVNALGSCLDHNVDLMRWAQDAQHVVVGVGDEAGDDASMMARHGVFAVRQHADELGTPLVVVQSVHEFGDQVENVFSQMAFEHRHRDEVQVDQLAAIADAYV